MDRRLLAALVLSALAGCATISTKPMLDADAGPDPKLGYVAGSFSVGGESRFAFQLMSDDRTTLHFGFGEQTTLGYETRMISLPPGTYWVESWVPYGRGGGEDKRQLMDGALGNKFVVRPGHVVFLGKFTAFTQVTRLAKTIRYDWQFRPEKIPADEVAAAVQAAYPKFEAAPLECLLCQAPPPDATSYAMPVKKPE